MPIIKRKYTNKMFFHVFYLEIRLFQYYSFRYESIMTTILLPPIIFTQSLLKQTLAKFRTNFVFETNHSKKTVRKWTPIYITSIRSDTITKISILLETFETIPHFSTKVVLN